MKKVKIPLKQYSAGCERSGFSYRISSVDFLIMQAFIDNKEVQLEVPGSTVYCKGHLLLNQKINDDFRVPMLYDGETTFIRNSLFFRSQIKIWEDIENGVKFEMAPNELCELALEDHEKALIHAAFSAFTNSGGLCQKVVDWIVRDKKIQAIKQYRITYGTSLRESKDMVDKLWDHVRSGPE